MAFRIGNRIRQGTTTVGVGTLTLAVAVFGFQTLAQAGLVDGDTCPYFIEDAGGKFEVGIGTVGGSGTTLTRDTVRKSYDGSTYGTSKLSLSGGANLTVAPSAEDIPLVGGAVAWTGQHTFSVAPTVGGNSLITSADGVTAGTANTIAKRDSNADLTARLLKAVSGAGYLQPAPTTDSAAYFRSDHATASGIRHLRQDGTTLGWTYMDGANLGFLKADANYRFKVNATSAYWYNDSNTEFDLRSAASLYTGTLPDARLSTNVPLLNAVTNAFTGAATTNGLMTIMCGSGAATDYVFGVYGDSPVGAATRNFGVQRGGTVVARALMPAADNTYNIGGGTGSTTLQRWNTVHMMTAAFYSSNGFFNKLNISGAGGSADRTLTIATGDANRSFTIDRDLTATTIYTTAEGATAATASKVAVRDGNADLFARYFWANNGSGLKINGATGGTLIGSVGGANWEARSDHASDAGIRLMRQDGTTTGFVYGNPTGVGMLNAAGTWMFFHDGSNLYTRYSSSNVVVYHAGHFGLPTSTPTAGRPAAYDGNGYLFAAYLNQSSGNNENPTVSQIIVNNGSDGYNRKASAAHVGLAVAGRSAPISTINASGASTVDFDGLFSSTYRDYEITCYDVSVSTEDARIYAQFKVNGSWQSTNYEVSNGDGTGVLCVGPFRTGGRTGTIEFKIGNPLGTSLYKNATVRYGHPRNDNPTFYAGVHGAEYIGSTAAVTGVRFYVTSGTFSGSFKLRGIN